MSSFKLKGESLDIVEENILKLKELFPEMVNGDNEIDFDAFREIFESSEEIITDDSEEHYKFTWWGKKEAKKIAKETTTKTLRPSKKDSKNWDTTENIYIEGDNLDALKILLGSYRNRIKAIYIDPPYNTGKDFVYKDNRVESTQEHLESTGQLSEEGYLFENAKTDGKYHSNWLNMMYPRLVLARKLLTRDGFIFISIDNNEYENLKKICDEIFGEENFITPIVPILNPRGSQSSNDIAINHEYILVYRKSNHAKLYGLELTEQQKSEYNNEDENGFYREIGLRKRGADSRREDSPTLFYPIYYNQDTEELSLVDSEGFIEIVPKLSNGDYGRWRWSKQKVEKDKNQLIARLVNKRDGSKAYDIFQKDYLTSDKLRKPMSIWQEKEINNEVATEMIQELFGFKIFDYTKSIYLISKILQIATTDSDIVLDFFSGSASTAHAVIEKNKLDNKNRKFIMVQIDEETDEKSEAYKEGYKNICEIGKERIRRAGDKIVEESGNSELDIGFKVFKIDESNFIPWNPKITSENVEQAILTTADNLVQGRSELDLVYELLLKLNMDLNSPVEETNINGKKVYIIDNGYALICLENRLDTSIADDLVKLKEELMVDYSQVILKDEALDDNSSINIYETLKSNGVEFYTI